MIRDDPDLDRHVNYIHYNPVKHGCVRRAVDWEFSTFHRYVQAGWIPENWGGETIPDTVEGWGELANPNIGIENIGPSGFVFHSFPRALRAGTRKFSNFSKSPILPKRRYGNAGIDRENSKRDPEYSCG
uniref:Transposase n=1 Tax=Candidatus Kentrum sp. DK TaxID=2126562 RepID=A0A450SMG3_9GAMM|nr:MAG: hypothetical protein BECKDK2373C_GA0170839_10458 [Candidatus Kentron sp. DK]